jgi:anti-anti-sigma factor
MTVSERSVGSVTIIDVSGNVTLTDGAEQVRDKVRSILQQGQKSVLVNLAKVSYMDSAGLGELVQAYSTVAKQGGKLKLVSPTNKRKYRVIVIGSGLAGASAAASLAELGYQVACFCYQDSPRRAHSTGQCCGLSKNSYCFVRSMVPPGRSRQIVAAGTAVGQRDHRGARNLRSAVHLTWTGHGRESKNIPRFAPPGRSSPADKITFALKQHRCCRTHQRSSQQRKLRRSGLQIEDHRQASCRDHRAGDRAFPGADERAGGTDLRIRRRSGPGWRGGRTRASGDRDRQTNGRDRAPSGVSIRA